MAIRDLRTLSHNTHLTADIVIVGGGPAGLSIARELAHTKLHVLVVDSGGFHYDAETEGLNAVENIGQPVLPPQVQRVGRGYSGDLAWLNDIPAFELRNRLLGGSTHTWVGKCAAFDDMDFAARAWLPNTGWPIGRRELQPALDRAADLLNLGPNVYDEKLFTLLRSPPAELGIDRDLLRPFFWQFSHELHQRGEPMRFIHLVHQIKGTNVDFLTHATTTDIKLDNHGRRATAIEVRSMEGKRAVIVAKTIVLCAGGVENARLLLASNSQMQTGIGNGRDVVGRYMVDHPRTSLASVTGADIEPIARHFNFYGLVHDGRTQFYLRGLSLSPEIQAREELTNCATYPVQIHAADDPWMALKRLLRGSRQGLGADVGTVIRSAPMVAAGIYERLLRKRGLPHRSIELRFDAMAEQQLDRDSRVTLSDKRDRFGTPLPRVDWKIGATETLSMKRLARLLSDEFARVGLPRPRLADWIAADDDSKAAFMDMAHPSSTTRMGTDPTASVVDTNSMVHGIDGLFVAGSSVFPTGGHANPTLMVLTLAIRLADHLKTRHQTEKSVAVATA
jgi:choline dehydrogenase-like flavoprotein